MINKKCECVGKKCNGQTTKKIEKREKCTMHSKGENVTKKNCKTTNVYWSQGARMSLKQQYWKRPLISLCQSAHKHKGGTNRTWVYGILQFGRLEWSLGAHGMCYDIPFN